MGAGYGEVARRIDALEPRDLAPVPSSILRNEFQDEVTQRHVADIVHDVDHRLAPVHDRRLDLDHLSIAPDLLAQHRAAVETDFDALRMTVAGTRLPDRQYLFVDEEGLALMHGEIGWCGNTLGGRADR